MSGIKGFQATAQRQYASWGGCVTWLDGESFTTADAITAAGLDWIGETLLATPMQTSEAQRFLHKLLPYDRKVDLDKSRKDRNRAEAHSTILSLLETKDDLQNIKGTRYGMYQAIADYSDHHRSEGRDTDVASAAENRFYRIAFAEGKREGGLKDRALDLLLK